ncbi:MAG: hypothetical protein ABI666_10745 [Ferruginibacter sp.]
MTFSTNSNSKPPGASLATIIKTWLLAGTLDILSAFTYYYIKTEKNPLNVLSYVSKVALGETTFTSTGLQQLSGLLVHFAIAFSWTIFFFIMYPRLKWLQLNKFITAVVYGIFVWTMMNLVILPLWNNKAFVYKGETSIINCLILIVAIGIPLSFIAHNQYSKKENQ